MSSGKVSWDGRQEGLLGVQRACFQDYKNYIKGERALHQSHHATSNLMDFPANTGLAVMY